MKTYTMTIEKNFYKHLEQAVKFVTNSPKIEITKVIEGKYNTDYEVSVTTLNDKDFFQLGYFTERAREMYDNKQFDLRDQSTVTLDIPDSFLLLCKIFNQSPISVLTLFAGDVSFHPFTSCGSDEREMAKDYFLRAYAMAESEDQEEIFEKLYVLRKMWKGNSHMDEYKTLYREKIAEWSASIPSESKVPEA